MTDQFRDKLVETGVDVPTALARFMGNSGLYEKFLRKFLADENFYNLCSAVTEKDVDRAFAAAHTLKGVAGNLGLDCISTPLVPVVEKLRAGSLDGVEEALEKMDSIYGQLCSVIRAEGQI